MSEPRRRELGKILFTEHDIDRRVSELGKEISLFYRGRPVTAVGVLKGALFFMADLVRRIETPLVYDFYRVASYGAATAPEAEPRLLLPARTPLAGRDVLVVEDIVDTGRTLDLLRRAIAAEGPASLRVCVLLDKRERRRVEAPVEWVGFTIPNRFVVGYGLDHDERFRNLPYLAFLREPWA